MEVKYHVEGLTCGNCKTHVEKALVELNSVLKADVNLNDKTVTLKSNEAIELSTLQNTLPEKYTISNIVGTDINTEPNTIQEQSKLQQLKPLFLILTYISVACILLHQDDWNIKEMMLDFMGLFLIVFSFFKMLDIKGFANTFSMYDPLAKLIPFYGRIYPFIETVLGLMFLLRFRTNIALMVTIIILGITTFGVTKTLLDKRQIKCACLGTALNLPMTEATFIENAIMIVMGVFMLVNYV